jgi:hypothetical protein
MDGPAPPVTPPPPAAAKRRTRTPGQTLTCGWCNQPITVRATGRTPKWCSDTCRHRAWETSRAAAAGKAAVTIVERVIEVQVPTTVEVQVPVPTLPKAAAWPAALTELARQLDTGAVYDRDLPALADALAAVLTAYRRRPAGRRHPLR